MKCARKGCDREGTHHLVAKVWAIGFPKSSAPITSVIGMQLCKDHAHAEATSRDLISDDFWGVVDMLTRARGLVPADLASLELVPTRGSAEEAIGSLWGAH